MPALFYAILGHVGQALADTLMLGKVRRQFLPLTLKFLLQKALLFMHFNLKSHTDIKQYFLTQVPRRRPACPRDWGILGEVCFKVMRKTHDPEMVKKHTL